MSNNRISGIVIFGVITNNPIVSKSCKVTDKIVRFVTSLCFEEQKTVSECGLQLPPNALFGCSVYGVNWFVPSDSLNVM